MPGNTFSSQNTPSEDASVLEQFRQGRLLTDTIQKPADNADPKASVDTPDLEIAFPPPADKARDSANEQEWSEHSATAWALAYVIHRIRSTPLPPILLPEQRRHFQKVIQMASALMEEWQRRERDQAQQLAAARPPGGPLAEPPEISENTPGDPDHAGESLSSESLLEPPGSLPQHLASDLQTETRDHPSTHTENDNL
jgi:hypothetical protein